MGNNWRTYFKLNDSIYAQKVVKREEMELPANFRRGLLAHSEGLRWIEPAKVANLTPHAMRQWRKYPNAENFINHDAINSSLEESLGKLAQATPALANKLIKIALDEKLEVTLGYQLFKMHFQYFRVELLIERINLN